MEYEVRTCTAKDIKALRGKLREEDKTELRRMYGLEEPHLGVINAYRRSTETYVGLIDGEVAVVWGVWAPGVFSDNAYAWLLGTEVIERSPVIVARHTRRELRKLMRRYPYLENWVDNDNTFSKKWLQWLGFTIEKPEPMGCSGELFCHFYKDVRKNKGEDDV